MTTVVANLRCMAADRRVSDESGSAPMEAQKVFTIAKRIFGAAGDFSAICAFMDWRRRGGRGKRPGPSAGCMVMELSKDGLHYWEGDTRVPILSDFYAIGSGSMAALAALECGASPAESIRIAAKYDPYTGPTSDVMWLSARHQKEEQKHDANTHPPRQ